MIGRTLGHYRIIEKIDEGGMGEVYRARDEHLDRDVAVKVLPTGALADEQARRRFRKEAEALSKLNHPNIAAVYDFDTQDGVDFLVMEKIAGPNLAEKLARGPLPEQEVARLGSEVAAALEEAHEHRVVHRDLKPGNIKVTPKGHVKVLDFGLARLLKPFSETASTETLTETHALAGTLPYMAPEQLRRQPADARSDIWALGVVLYEATTGARPFQGGSGAEVGAAILRERPRPWPGQVSAELRLVIERCLEKEPERRFQRACEIRAALETIQAGRVAPWTVWRYQLARRPWVLLAATLLALLVGGYALYRFSQGPVGIGASGRPAIAVMPFESSSSSDEMRWLSQGVPNMLLTGLAQTPGLDVIGSQRLREAAKQTGQADLETLDKGLLRGVAREAGAGAVVTGSIFQAGVEMRIDVQVEDITSGRVLFAHSVQGKEVFLLVDDLTGRIQNSLNLTVAAGGSGIARTTSTSLEAYRLYTEGMVAIGHIRERDAARLFKRAVELDPSFAMAYFQLSNLPQFRGNPALAEEYRRKTMAHLDRLPERQKLLVQAAFALESENNPDKAIGLLEDLLARYPDEEEAYLWLSRAYHTLNQRDQALAALERGVHAVPQSGTLHNSYGYSLLYADRVPEALREFKVYTGLYPEESNSWDSLAEAYLITYQPDKALKEYGEVLRRFPSRASARRGRAWAFAMLGRYPQALDEFDTLYSEQFLAYRRRTGFPNTNVYFNKAFLLSRLGRYREMEEFIRRGMEETARLKDYESQAAFEALSSLISLERGENARALRSAGRALSGSPHGPESPRVNPVLANVLAGLAEARAGNPTAARANLESARKAYNPSQPVERWWYHCLEGEIALEAGDLMAAETAFAAGEPERRMFFNNSNPIPTVFGNNLLMRDWPARIKKARGDLLGAIEVYRKLLTPGINNKWVAVYEPRFVLEMARLYEQAGDKAAARRAYQRFADLWKNADPGLPELQEARQRSH